MIGAFMAILNIQITNASLLDIEGGIGTGVDNGAWISTSYLIGEIIVIPLTDYLSRVFSFRRYMLANAVLFPVFSIACAFTHDLGSMIVMRGLQGFAGGILIPMAFTMVLTKLPKAQQPIGLALFALSRDLRAGDRPDHRRLSHRELRLADDLLRQRRAERRHGRRARLDARARADAALPAEGRRLGRHRHHGDRPRRRCRPCSRKATRTTGSPRPSSSGWRSSPPSFSRPSSAIELTVEKPLVNLRLLKRRNFGIGVLANVLVGFALFGSVYILPQYLGQAQGYNAEQIGNVLAWTGLPQLVLIPLVPLLMKRFDPRYIGFVGISIFAASCFMNVTLSPDNAGDQLLIPNIVRAIGQALVLTPISTITTAGIAPSEAGAASGLSNMLRNLGGAVGTAMLATVLTKREQFHSNIIGQSVTLYREEVRAAHRRDDELFPVARRLRPRRRAASRRSSRSARSSSGRR